MALSIEEIEDKLTKAWRLVTDQPETAAHGIRTILNGNQLHVGDMQIVITHADRKSTLFSFMNENRELREQVQRLRGTKGLTWSAFHEVVSQRMTTKGSKWRNVLASYLGVTQADLKQWEDGNRVPMAMLKQVEDMPDSRADDKAATKKTNFLKVAGVLVDHLRMQAVAPSEIARLLTDFVTLYDGNEVGLDMVLGRRSVVSQDEILPADDVRPLTLRETTAMGVAMFGKDANKRPMVNFILAHLQVDVSGFNTNKALVEAIPTEGRLKLRAAYHDEMALRAKSERYARFSLAFRNLPKRTKRIRGKVDVGTLAAKKANDLIEVWFGADSLECLSTLSGWRRDYCKDVLGEGRPVPLELQELILGIETCLTVATNEGVALIKHDPPTCLRDLDDPNFVDVVFRVVKQHIRGDDE